MIDVFRQITNFANPESSELARGISEALVTTKFGLITAIPSLIVHALLSRRLQERKLLHYNGIEIVDALLSQDGVVLIFKEEDAPRAYEKLRTEIR